MNWIFASSVKRRVYNCESLKYLFHKYTEILTYHFHIEHLGSILDWSVWNILLYMKLNRHAFSRIAVPQKIQKYAYLILMTD